MEKNGDALYLSTSAKLKGKVTLENNVIVAANSVVTKSCEEGNALLAGMPACNKYERKTWYIEENKAHILRIEVIENYKSKFVF